MAGKVKDGDTRSRWVTNGKKPYRDVKIPEANRKAIEEINRKRKKK